MPFLPSRILDAQHHVLPLAILILVHSKSFLESLTHLRSIIHINASHKRKSLWNNRALRPMVILELSVVRTDIRQLVFLLLVTLTNSLHHLLQPSLGEQLVKLLRGLCLCTAAPFQSRLCICCYHLHRVIVKVVAKVIVSVV